MLEDIQIWFKTYQERKMRANLEKEIVHFNTIAPKIQPVLHRSGKEWYVRNVIHSSSGLLFDIMYTVFPSRECTSILDEVDFSWCNDETWADLLSQCGIKRKVK